MLSRAHGFNHIPNHPNLHIVGMESALKPVGGHGRNLKFYPSPDNRQTQDVHVDKQSSTSTGIIYDIPLGADLQSYQKVFNQNGRLIKSIYRVTNRNKGPTECVKLVFNTAKAPTLLRSDTDYIVHPYRIPYLLCNQCQEHGHSTVDLIPMNSVPQTTINVPTAQAIMEPPTKNALHISNTRRQ